MSQRNVEVMRQGLQAFNDRDVERLLALTDPEAEWHPFRAQLEGIVYRGHEGIRRFLADMTEDWDTFTIELLEVIEVGETLVTIGRISGVGKGSGVEVDTTAGFVSDFREGRILRLMSYSDPAAARAAAGLDA
jgi:ketosteroid isomerase-like protein